MIDDHERAMGIKEAMLRKGIMVDWNDRLSCFLVIASLVWCVLIGLWIWLIPGFIQVSSLGPVPLIVPVVLSALAAWAAWRRLKAVLAVIAFLLAGFTILTGFSIGAAYILPTCMLSITAILAVIAKR